VSYPLFLLYTLAYKSILNPSFQKYFKWLFWELVLMSDPGIYHLATNRQSHPQPASLNSFKFYFRFTPRIAVCTSFVRSFYDRKTFGETMFWREHDFYIFPTSFIIPAGIWKTFESIFLLSNWTDLKGKGPSFKFFHVEVGLKGLGWGPLSGFFFYYLGHVPEMVIWSKFETMGWECS